MQRIVWHYQPTPLRSPILVCAFSGWNDAGESATSAVNFLGTALKARRFAHIDPEEFFDFREARPTVGVPVEGKRYLQWPTINIYEARAPKAARDLILISGPEPSLRWRTFCQCIVELAEALGVHHIVGLGSLLADVTHTRPVALVGSSSDATLFDTLRIRESSYEGPTGIVGALYEACGEVNIGATTLWAAIPHYVATVHNPKAALALVRKLERIVEITVDASDLEISSIDYEQKVTAAVHNDEEINKFVERLEALDEEELTFDPDNLPSGDALASDFQRFLNQLDDR